MRLLVNSSGDCGEDIYLWAVEIDVFVDVGAQLFRDPAIGVRNGEEP